MDFEEKFRHMLANMKVNPPQLQAFIDNPQPVLEAAGIPVVGSWAGVVAGAAAAPARAPSYKLTVETPWWGVDFIMNEDLTQAIATGSYLGPPLVALCTGSLAVAGIVSGPVAAVIAAAFAVVMAAKTVQIKLTDQGNGVHWPITWIQWAGVVAAVPGGPGAVTAAMLLFIHPLPN